MTKLQQQPQIPKPLCVHAVGFSTGWDCVRIRDLYGACRSLEVHFDNRKWCRKLVEVWRVRFDNRRVCRRLEVVRRVHLTMYKVCISSENPFDYRKECMRLYRSSDSPFLLPQSVYIPCTCSKSRFCPLQKL